MPLKFPGKWRFTPPADGDFVNSAMPHKATSEFLDLIDKIRTDSSRKGMYEHFKSAFGMSSRSSSEDWALSDLHSAMDCASAMPLRSSRLSTTHAKT